MVVHTSLTWCRAYVCHCCTGRKRVSPRRRRGLCGRAAARRPCLLQHHHQQCPLRRGHGRRDSQVAVVQGREAGGQRREAVEGVLGQCSQQRTARTTTDWRGGLVVCRLCVCMCVCACICTPACRLLVSSCARLCDTECFNMCLDSLRVYVRGGTPF